MVGGPNEPRWKEGDGAPLPAQADPPSRQRPACFLLRVYKIRDLLTMFAPTGTCARAPRPCTPVTHKRCAPRRGGPFGDADLRPEIPPRYFIRRPFLRADISTIDPWPRLGPSNHPLPLPPRRSLLISSRRSTRVHPLV